MTVWHRGKYAQGRYTCGNYSVQKDKLWHLKYNGVEVSQSTTLREAKASAYEHFQKMLAALRNNGL